MPLPPPEHNDLHEDDYLYNGKLTQLGIDYLSQFKCFNLFSQVRTVILFILFLPVTIPLAILRVLALFVVFSGGFLLKKYFSIHLDNYPKIINILYFLCLGVYLRVKDPETVGTPPGVVDEKRDRSTVIVTNHHSRFDAMLLANLHQADATYRAAAKTSFFGKLIIGSGLCSRAMEEGIAVDTKEGRGEWRRRLSSAYARPMLFFPEGRVVQKPKTIMTFQNHLLSGQKVDILCRKSSYQSYFLDHTQIEIPFFKAPYSRFKNKLLWDSLIEGLPFLISLFTVFETEVIGTIHLNGSETLEEIDESLYSLYLENGFRLVTIDPLLAKKLLQSLYL